MAYIIGLADADEVKKLEARGFEAEVASPELAKALFTEVPVSQLRDGRLRVVWIDAGVLDMLSCPVCCDNDCVHAHIHDGTCPDCGARVCKCGQELSCHDHGRCECGRMI
ncbi:MAG: hypothetical protein A2W26_04850 [Acidobacteria bacterium RBG_16_64_8]|nr:MAG: hypothetical protein A2W26_04850 [Acidobacteria bacterium RBG_16_64_8]